MSTRRDRVHNLLNEGKSRRQVADLTGESLAYVARVDRSERRKGLTTILQAIGGERGQVEIVLVSGEIGQPEALLIAPADRSSDVDQLLNCLKNSFNL